MKRLRVAPRLTGILVYSTLILLTGRATTAADLTEFEAALSLAPDLKNGRRLYIYCVSCHGPEGWGREDGTYPQIAGQLASVIIKQLADIRVGNRANPIMRAFTSPRVLGGAQEIADVAAYVASLPMTPHNGRGPEHLLPEGQAIYAEQCADCHGKHGEGDAEDHIPRLQGQHFNYLKRQFDHIRTGKRRNADRKMARQIRAFSRHDENAVLSHVSHLRPPAEKLARPGWINPDFPHVARPAPGNR
nr:c-type cytochrome [endosymbiont of unidentified scaly snail isolate Monju]